MAIAMTACASRNNVETEYQVLTEIISEPPGARIEVNGDYVGDTPVSTRIRHHPSDMVVMGEVTIRATPIAPGQFVQTKVFKGPKYPFDPNRDRVPGKVFFDMRLVPSTPDGQSTFRGLE